LSQINFVITAILCISQAFTLQLFLGKNLKTMEDSFRKFYERTSDLGQSELVLCLKPYFQTILNLQCTRLDLTSDSQLSGEVMIEEEFFEEIDKSGNIVLKIVFYLLKANLAETFENFKLAFSLYELIEKSLQCISLSYGILPWWGSAGHANYRMFLLSGRRIHLRKARMYKKRLEKIVHLGCQNACSSVAYLHVTEAAVCGVSMSDIELISLVTRSLTTASDFRHVKLEACIYEEAGFACWRRGLISNAKQCFQQALHIQENLGAFAKHHWLSEAINGLYI
jgi:tetratricopeptide (TPR) repeat protein